MYNLGVQVNLTREKVQINYFVLAHTLSAGKLNNFASCYNTEANKQLCFSLEFGVELN
jgi:hypothetical protein